MKSTGRLLRKYIPPLSLLLILLPGTVLIGQMTAIGEYTAAVYTAGSVLILLPIGWILASLVRDGRDRNTAAEQLATINEKYRALLETSSDGILLILGSEIKYANFVFLAMSGYTMKEILGKDPDALLEIDDPGGSDVFNNTGEAGRTANLEALIRCKRGDLREVILAVSGIHFMETGGHIVVVRDISGREKLEKESMDLMSELQSSLLQMNLPVSSIVREHITCGMDLSLREAAALMARKAQDAIIITKDNSQPVGILTDSDLRSRVLAMGLDPGIPVFQVMSSPIIRIGESSLLYEAILKVKEHGISHLAVEDKNGRIAGIFSNRDMLEMQRNSISYLVREIETAVSVEALKKIHDKIPVLIRILLASGSRIMNITYMISTITDAITHRLVEFAIEEMGEPPVPFAFMALGSEGRREQTLVTDQDNAIIFEDVSNEKIAAVNRYFLYFGKKINLWLDRIGYRYCPGEVMAGNPQWCQPVSKWKKYFTDWVNARSEEGLLGVAVFFDFRIVFGMEQYGEELRRHIGITAAGKSGFFRFLAREAGGHDIPAALPHSFEIKNALTPLVDFIRVYSVHNQVSETNTMLRLERLRRMNIIDEKDYQEFENVYNRLMEIRFRSHVNAILNNEVPDNLIRQEELTSIEKNLVEESFAVISHCQAKLASAFA